MTEETTGREPEPDTGDDTAEHEPVADDDDPDRQHVEIPDDADVPPGNEPDAVGADGRQDEDVDNPEPAEPENDPPAATDGDESADEPKSDRE